MKTVWKRRAAAASLAVIVATQLFGCSQLVKITREGDAYVDKTNGVAYLSATVSYEAVGLGEKYARYKLKKSDVILYEVEGVPPENLLAEKLDGIGSLYYAEDEPLPSLEEFGASSLTVYYEAGAPLVILTVDDAADLAAIAEAMSGGEETDMPLRGSASYTLKFTSDKYPAIYYTILYIEDTEDGRVTGYFYDRGEKRCVEAGDLLARYLHADYSDADATDGG